MKCYFSPNPNPPYNLLSFRPNYNYLMVKHDLTQEQALEYAIQKNIDGGLIPIGNPIYRLEDDLCPDDPYFGDAWVWENDKIVVNFEKACTVHMDWIRVERNKYLVSLDIPHRLAMNKWVIFNNEEARLEVLIIIEKMDILRNIPANFMPNLQRCTSLEQLKETWPPEIPTRPITRDE